jgi:hypothetical protein
MASVLCPEGLLVLTSRNWERQRSRGSGLEVADELVERHGRPGLVLYAWTIPESWDAVHILDVSAVWVRTVPIVPARHVPIASELAFLTAVIAR